MSVDSKKEKKFVKKLKNKYRLVIMRDETFEERLSFRLSRLNVFVVVGTAVILLIVATTFLIAYTPLREYIPGYADVNVKKNLNFLLSKTDSLEAELYQKEIYVESIRKILTGEDSLEKPPKPKQLHANYDTITITKSKEDSLLRKEIEQLTEYNLNIYKGDGNNNSISSFSFFPPIKGILTSHYSIPGKHYGVDIVASENELVKSTLDGTVIFSSWTLETGYVIGIQHKNNIMSVYKHNSVLLKEQGSVVKAGDPIAIIGETGELQSGPHLHFELWHNGRAIDPEEHIAF